MDKLNKKEKNLKMLFKIKENLFKLYGMIEFKELIQIYGPCNNFFLVEVSYSVKQKIFKIGLVIVN